MPTSTILYFATGGLFASLYANAVRQLPLLRKPLFHITSTAFGAGLGVLVSEYETGADKRLAEYRQIRENRASLLAAAKAEEQ